MGFFLMSKRFSMIYNVVIFCLVVFLIACTQDKTHKSGKILIEILYMNHGPVQPVLKKLKAEFKQFETKAEFQWYDFEKDLDFKKKKGIDFHVPIVIWINNKNSVEINGEKILLQGFPKNEGPKFARGVWEVKDLITAIKNITGD